MLNDELRVNSGLTYGASSRFNALKNGGSFAISTFTAEKTTEPAIDKALEVLNKLHKMVSMKIIGFC
jgi:predicted Zn-dependent peptidase